MNQLEENITQSFKLVKNDIIQLQNTLATISQNQERIMEWIQDTRDKENALYQKMKDMGAKLSAQPKPQVIKVKDAVHFAGKRSVKKYVASRTGKTVHVSNCPFAKNIKPKSKVVFASKTKALNMGYKACMCIKKI